MKNKNIDKEVVAMIAAALQELKPQMIFVGGATLSLYINDVVADEIRNTNDIDLTIQLTGYAEWAKMQERLSQLGFYPNPEGHAICSYIYQGILADIMPSEDGHMGKANTWYKPGFDYLQMVMAENIEVKILSAPYFLATKFEAFHSRGGDYRTSHDFEDIIFVLDNRTTIVEEILAADSKVKPFLKTELLKVLSNSNSEEIISCHIHPSVVKQRYQLVLEKINKIIS